MEAVYQEKLSKVNTDPARFPSSAQISRVP